MKFKVGDRVRVYGGALNGADRMTEMWGNVYTVDGVSEEAVWVKDKVGCPYRAHPKQCRKLLKRERRSWKLGAGAYYAPKVIGGPSLEEGEIVEVVEVRKPK